uniref:C2H2-type domain-containing protein n=1 Tax=Timema douglasi TaxID=61478 RepID=A0A7R8Z666_TIMDO|nr:unnamed protein product [Timema douglasi]
MSRMKITKKDAISAKIKIQSKSHDKKNRVSKCMLEKHGLSLAGEVRIDTCRQSIVACAHLKDSEEGTLIESLHFSENSNNAVGTETSVIWSNEGILRQALMCFNYPHEEVKPSKNSIPTKLTSDHIHSKLSTPLFSESFDINTKLSHSPPKSLAPELNHLSTHTLSKSSPLISGGLSLENISLVSDSFSQDGRHTSLLHSLPHVSEIPRPGNILPTLLSASRSDSKTLPSSSCPSDVATTSSIITTIPFNSRPGSAPILSEIISPLQNTGVSPLKVILPATTLTGNGQPFLPSVSPREAAVTVVYSALSKGECASQTHQTPILLSSIMDVKSNCSNDLNSMHRQIDSNNSMRKTSQPLPSHVLCVDHTGDVAPSLLNNRMIPVKVCDSSNITSNVSQTITLPSPSAQTVKPCTNRSLMDINSGIYIPVSSKMLDSKLDSLTALSDNNQIITIPLTSSTIYSHLPISIPVSSNSLSFPILSCTSNSSAQDKITLSSNHNSLQTQTHDSITSTTDNDKQSYAQKISEISPTTTHSLICNNIHDNASSDSLTSSLTNDLPITSGTNTIAITSNSLIISSSSSSVLTTSEINSSTSLDSSSFAVQSPAEILSQLSKAGVLPAMSSSQVSSVLSDLGPDNDLDLDGDSAHHELMSHQIHLSDSPDKVSSLAQAEDLELGHTVSSEDTLIVQHVMHMLNHQHEQALPPKPPDIDPSTHNILHNSSGLIDHSENTNPLPPIYKANSVSRDIPPNIRLVNTPMNELGSQEHRSLRQYVFIKEEHTEAILNSRNKSEIIEGNKCVDISNILCQHKESIQDQETMSESLSSKENKKRKRGVDALEQLDFTNFIEEVCTFKCKFCFFLSLKKEGICLHLRQEHLAQMTGGRGELKRKLKCPGCPNVFFCIKSLRVHLSQDHQVGDAELKTIVETVVNGTNQVKVVKKKTKKKPRKDQDCESVDEVDGVEDKNNEKAQDASVDSQNKVPVIDIDRTASPLPLVSSASELPGIRIIDVRGSGMLAPSPELNPGTDESLSELPALELGMRAEMSVLDQVSKLTKVNSDVFMGSSRPESVGSLCGYTEEPGKIRVRNLNSESSVVNSMDERDSGHVAQLRGLQNDLGRDKDTPGKISDISDDEAREDGLVIDDDSFLHQKKLCSVDSSSQYEDIKSERCNSKYEAGICNEHEKSQDIKKPVPITTVNNIQPAFVRKRGRPKGSKNSVVNGTKTEGAKSEKGLGYRCDVMGCAVRLHSHDKIEYHRRCHQEAVFQCPECSHSTFHWNSLSSHLWRGHAIDMELYSCNQCDYKTISHSKLVNVHSRIHGDERPFLCDICGKGFKNPKQLRNHKVTHSTKQKPVIAKGECDICGRTFGNQRMLRLHKDNLIITKPGSHLARPFSKNVDFGPDHSPVSYLHLTWFPQGFNPTFNRLLRSWGTPIGGLESSLMFSCWMCSFRSVKKENYLAHVANHETGAIPNRRVTHSPQASEAAPKKSSKESPVIIDLTSLHDVTGSSDSQEAFPDSNGVEEDGAENIELVYSSSSVVEELIQQAPSGVGKDGETFVVEMEPHSVIHLAQASSLLSSSNCQTLKSSASLDGMIMIPLSPEFEVEAEEITGDIRESQDLKFKSLPQEFKSLPQDLGFKVMDDT